MTVAARPAAANWQRREDWPARLEAAIAAWRDRPFAWGTADCGGFVCDVILAMTGVDLYELRGRYSDGPSACRALGRLVGAAGGATVEDAATHYLGAPLASPLLAQRGDVVSVMTPDGPALAICAGRAAAYVGAAGVATVPLADWRKAWRV